MHILITGEIGAGKSTLVQKLLAHLGAPVYGFRTIKQLSERDAHANVHLHPATGPLICSEGNLVGICDPGGPACFPEVFNTLGVRLLSDIPPGSLVLMDELGFMESKADAFSSAVLRVLEGPYRALAVVKPRSTTLLDAVRAHPEALLYRVEAGNRDSLEDVILRDIGHGLR